MLAKSQEKCLVIAISGSRFLSQPIPSGSFQVVRAGMTARTPEKVDRSTNGRPFRVENLGQPLVTYSYSWLVVITSYKVLYLNSYNNIYSTLFFCCK